MAKCKYNFSKEELEWYYNEYESYSLAGKKLGISKNTFRQQYLKSQGLCMICAEKIPDDHDSFTCEECLDRNRVKDKSSTKVCECGNQLTRKEGQSKLSWSKKKYCDECLELKYKESAKRTYLKYRYRNLEKDRNDPKIKAYQKAYRDSKEGQLRRRISNSKRRAIKVTTASPNINEYIEALYNLPSKECPYCPSTEALSIDHILPLSRGGSHTEDNIELICLTCNIRKGNKTKEEFIQFLNEIKR